MIQSLLLPHAVREQIFAEASAAHPRECCGLIEGILDPARGEARAMAAHPVRNLAQSADRFDLDPGPHIRLMKSLRGTGRAIIGCYHSHPNGRTEPSAADREGAVDDGFLWLIAAGNALHAFVPWRGAFHPVRLAIISESDAPIV